jgi:hypothetical protein
MTTQLVNVIGKVNSGLATKRVCSALADDYGAMISYGPTSGTVKVLATALDAIGVQDKAKFLENVSITVGDVIYLPFKVGAAGKYPWPAQVAIVAHECEHVEQGHDGWMGFWPRYFTSKAHRAAYEATALAAELEVYYRLTGRMLDVVGLAKGLEWYKVGKADIAVTAKHLAIVKNTLERGGEVSDQMRVIVKALTN